MEALHQNWSLFTAFCSIKMVPLVHFFFLLECALGEFCLPFMLEVFPAFLIFDIIIN